MISKTLLEECDALRTENKSIGDKLVRACMEAGELRVELARLKRVELEAARKVANALEVS